MSHENPDRDQNHQRLNLRVFRSPAAACLLLAAALSACGSSKSAAPPTSTASPPITSVKLTDAGCDPDTFTLPAGNLIFSVTNSGSTSVREMEIADSSGHSLGDVEGVDPGQTRSFVVDLKPGSYLVKCPQTASHSGTLTVK